MIPLISKEVEQMIFEEKSLTTENIEHFALILGVSGACLSDLRDIIKCFCQQQETILPIKNSNPAIQNLLFALKDSKVNQKQLADKINIHMEGLSKPHHSPTSPKMTTSIIFEDENEESSMITQEAAKVDSTADASHLDISLCILNPWLSAFSLCFIMSMSMVLNVLMAIQYFNPEKLAEENVQATITVGEKSCAVYVQDMYNSLPSAADIKVKDYAIAHVGDGIWRCGGHGPGKEQEDNYIQSITCHRWKGGRWIKFEHQMNEPRIRPRMFVEGNRVIVRGGETSDILSTTGCRASQEVFYKDNHTGGWFLEIIEKNTDCKKVKIFFAIFPKL